MAYALLGAELRNQFFSSQGAGIVGKAVESGFFFYENLQRKCPVIPVIKQPNRDGMEVAVF
jgi:hypothetical protein